uniref:Ammonium transporter AmtB-like domain-containing protein n=1 Tax=Ornithorhynchus anatinus TaxID=9258 RepID=F7FMC2_ORNAN
MPCLRSTSLQCRLPALLVLFQAVLLVLFILFVTYDEHTDPAAPAGDPRDNPLYAIFPLFQDIQVMLLVGLGLLLAFLKRYGFSAIAYNFLLTNFATQWALLVQGFLHHFHQGRIHLGMTNVLAAEFAAVTVLISVGAVLGRTSPIQQLLLALLEVPAYAACDWIITAHVRIVDVGGTITLHVFACYFGLGVSAALYRPGLRTGHPKQGSSYQSDLLSLAGTMFLWVFWPSFVAVLAQPGDAQHRAVLHTFLTLSASALTSFAASSLLEKRGRLSMAHLQNATLAGGVAIGAVADLMITPAGAFLLGGVSSLVCVLGFQYLSPFLARRLRLQDQCGIHNLHGLPGIVGALAGIVAIASTPDEAYGHQLFPVFPPRAPPGWNGTLVGDLPLPARTASEQALFQAAGLGVAFGVSLLGGYLTGWVLRLPFLAQPPDDLCFDDEAYFKVPDGAGPAEWQPDADPGGCVPLKDCV